MRRKLLLLAAVAAGMTALSCGGDSRVNVLVVLVDTVRADHFSCYGYERATTPNFDSLAAAGTLALNCQGQSSWTLPSMTSILSGVSPVEHTAGRTNGEFRGVPQDLQWLPLSFHRAGYRTAAFFNVMFMNEDFGFHRGFEHFDCQGVASGTSLRTAGLTTDDFLTWLDSSPSDKPFFAAVHFYDAHIPYNPPEPFASMYTDPLYEGVYGNSWGEGITEMMQVNSGETVPSAEDISNLMALYDGEISYLDDQAGRLFAELRNRGLAENTLIVVVGDHGEEFLDHGGIEHGRTLYQELVHVPLIIAGPGFDGGNIIQENVSQLDIAATLTAAAGIEYPAGAVTCDLSGYIDPRRHLPASGVLWRSEGDLVSIVSGENKVIWSVEDDSFEAFDLAADPGERFPLVPGGDMIEAAEYYRASPPLVESVLVNYSETVSRELRNLGYIR